MVWLVYLEIVLPVQIAAFAALTLVASVWMEPMTTTISAVMTFVSAGVKAWDAIVLVTQ